jgi:DNA-binding CsgD family transcriptional regulator
MWEERADRARRDISALAAAGRGVTELHTAAIELVGRYVSADLTCWAVIDPETLVISTMISGENRIPQEYEPRLAEAEYGGHEPHTFAALAKRQTAVARLSDLPVRDRNCSARLNEVWRPLGVDQELRVMFLADGVCWGAAGFVRDGVDFTDRETEFLAAVAPTIAEATRLAVRSHPRLQSRAVPPAIVVIGGRGELRSATPAARDWQRRLDDIAPGRFLLMMQVMALGARSSPATGFEARLRDAEGQWAYLRASPLIGSDENNIAVAIESATGDRLLGLFIAAYGLTPRERDICHEVIAGQCAADIAEHLIISVHTVQDHLKSVFAKVGVRSRGELVARLRPQAPSPVVQGRLSAPSVLSRPKTTAGSD